MLDDVLMVQAGQHTLYQDRRGRIVGILTPLERPQQQVRYNMPEELIRENRELKEMNEFLRAEVKKLRKLI